MTPLRNRLDGMRAQDAHDIQELQLQHPAAEGHSPGGKRGTVCKQEALKVSVGLDATQTNNFYEIAVERHCHKSTIISSNGDRPDDWS